MIENRMIVSRGYFSHDSSLSENVASARRVPEALPRPEHVTCHQYGISALVHKSSFCRETSGGVMKRMSAVFSGQKKERKKGPNLNAINNISDDFANVGQFQIFKIHTWL